MRPTRRYWAVAALAAALAVLAVAFDRPMLLVGAAGLAAYLLAAALAFHRALRRTAVGVEVDQATDRGRSLVDEAVGVTLAVAFEEPAPLDVEVEASLPVAAVGPGTDGRTAAVPRGGRRGGTRFRVSSPVAGEHRFGPPVLEAADPLGLLTETLRAGPAPTLTVEPRGPRDVHVGEGGDRLAAAFGDHRAGWIGPGLSPVELREYVPGDAASRIDWKATARLARPFVREHEAETDRVTALLVDHRSTTGVGPPGETKLDYLREVALAVTEAAREHGDPLGLYAVGDGGLTVARPPASTPDAYAAVRRDLLDLAPTSGDGSVGRTAGSPASARARARALEGEDSPFGATLRPFLADAAPYLHRIEDRPLFRVARTSLGGLRGTLLTVLLTDDADRVGVREATRVARRGDDDVVAFLAPDVLFDPGGLADLEAAYDRYRAFEAFRRELAGMDRVAAFEVARGARIEALLDAHRRRRAAGGRV